MKSIALSPFRAAFPSLNDRVHLASCSYVPRSTFVSEALEAMLFELEGKHPWSVYEHKVAQLRSLVANLLNCQVRQVALMPNASISAFQVANSLDWSARPRIIVSQAEFPSIAQVWSAQAVRGAEVVMLERSSGDADMADAYRRVLDERVGLASIPAVDFLTGAKLPVREIAAEARRLGAATFCDAYQAVGAEPVDTARWGVDYLVGGAMKYLLGLPGIAFLYAREPRAVQRVSELTGWQARVDPFAFKPQCLDFPESARRFETGTPAIAAVYAAIAGIEVLLNLTLEQVAERISALKTHSVRAFAVEGLEVRYLAPPERASGHISLSVEDAEPVVRHLLQRRIHVSPRLHTLRIAFHAFNDEEDVHILCKSLLAARDDGLL